MRRVFLFTVIWAAFLLCAYRNASATVEYCPAQLKYEAVGQPAAAAPTYGIILSALGPRTIETATLAFDTSNGWYTVDMPQVALVEKNRHYTSASAHFTRHDWVTPVMYVEFPSALTISHAWVYGASVTEDTLYGWPSGSVLCPPPASASPAQLKTAGKVHKFNEMDPKDQDVLTVPPAANSLVLHPRSSKPLESTACDEPFRDAEVSSQAEPEFPDIARGMAPGGVFESTVDVAIQPDGTLRDAWVWGPSGFDPVDASAVNAAKISRYKGARSYCQPVPGTYFFRVFFNANA